MGTRLKSFFSLLTLLPSLFIYTNADTADVDLTSNNRRPRISGLPDWTGAGFEGGQHALPTNADVGRTVTASELASTYGVIADDGQDDTAALQNAISSFSNGGPGAYILLELPAGVINLSHTIYIDSNYIIIRGASNDPDTGTRLVFSPDVNTKYDQLSTDGTQWDLDAMSFSWSYPDPDREGCGLGSNCGLITGKATSGWIWPGRSIFRIGTREIAEKFQTPYDLAPANRKDFFLGSVNYHWSIDKGKTKGFLALQSVKTPGIAGTNRIYIDGSTDLAYYQASTDVWIGSPVKASDYASWGVEHSDYYVNSYVFQDWFTITGIGSDDVGTYLELDHNLSFDVYADSTVDGSEEMEDSISYAKVMPIATKVHHVGIENLYMTQPMDGMSPSDAVHNYGNLAPESAMHGIVFRFAQHCWVRNIRTFMTGSHPIATEDARNIQIQDNYFDGAWNKGAGGNGYLRGSRVWDSIYFNNVLRNLRHITMQWCSMRNVVIMNNITNDMNLHGGYEGYNLFELNYASVAYEHRSGSCTANCGGEGGSTEGGTWWPIYWSTGDKASKWSGATGPQNVFYRNYMLKAPTPGADQQEYRPYFARDGSLSNIIWQFGWDRNTPNGDHYQHLSEGPLVGDGLLLDWQGHEQEDFSQAPNVGVNGLRTDQYTSLFLRDVTAATGVPSYTSIAGYAYCRGKVVPKVVGYYLASSATRTCQPMTPGSIDTSAYTHLLFAYANVASDGTVTLSSDQQSQLSAVLALGDDIKIYLAIGGWGLGTDPTPLQHVAVNSGGARTHMANSLASLVSTHGFDGVDIEWAPSITAAQFTTIVTTVKTALGTTPGISISVPQDFWQLSGVNAVSTTLRTTVDFISLLTHASIPGGSLTYPHSVAAVSAVVNTAQHAGFYPDLLLMPVPFYGRTYQASGDCSGEGCAVTGPGSTTTCIASGVIGQHTYPYYALRSALDEGNYDSNIQSSTWFDQTEYYQVLTLTDGSVVEFDIPDSVTNKVAAAIDMCMGGATVFSIDQDNANGDLMLAIWDAGAMAPSVEDIALEAMTGSPLTSDGFIDDSFWDSATTYLSNNYAWLPALSTYRVMVLIALRAQQDLANRLRNYLQYSDFTSDNFALYKKWQGKAVNWALANVTGYGRQHWACSDSQDGTYSASSCPHVFEQNDGDQPWLNVYWQLTDHDGFKSLVNQNLQMDIDTLSLGSIDVAQPASDCLNTNPGGGFKRDHFQHSVRRGHSHKNISYVNGPEPDRPHSSTRVSKQTRQDVTEPPDPYDPDPDCKSTWHGVYQIDPDTLFTNPSDTLNTWIQTQEAFTTTGSQMVGSRGTNLLELIALLQSILTSHSIGDGTVQSIETYIQQVRYDKQLQAQFDAYQAQNSGLQMFLDIFLTLITFIPGIGDGGLLIEAAVRGAQGIKGLARVAKAGEAAEESSTVVRVAETSVETADDLFVAGRESDGLLDSDKLATRGRLGSKFEKNNNAIKGCSSGTFDFLLDAADMAQAVYDASTSGGTRKRWEPSAIPSQEVPRGLSDLESLHRRAGGNKNPCIWTISKADELKDDYHKWCTQSSKTMTYNTQKNGGGLWLTGTYNDCKTDIAVDLEFDRASCECDHLLEAWEVQRALVPAGLSPADAQSLCSQFPQLTRSIQDVLNGQNNMEGLWKKSNTMKSFLIDPSRLSTNKKVITSSIADSVNNDEYEIARDHLSTYANRRQQVAQAVDALIQAQDSQTSSPLWKRIYTNLSPVDTARVANDASAVDKVKKEAEFQLIASALPDSDLTADQRAACKKHGNRPPVNNAPEPVWS